MANRHRKYVVIEEMSELAQAICKKRRLVSEKVIDKERYEKARRDIQGELADVLLTVAEMIYLYNDENVIQSLFDSKVERLKQQLEEAE